MDLFNEIWNSMVCFISGYAPVWGAPVGPGGTAWLILIGYNEDVPGHGHHMLPVV